MQSDYTKVHFQIGFGKLWKSAEEMAANTGLPVNAVKAEIDDIKQAHGVSSRVANGGYEYAMTARIKA